MANLRVLYIDDEADTHKMISKFEILKDEGIDVIPIAVLAEALGVVETLKGKIDAIVLDLIMPPGEVYSLEESNGGTSTGLRLLKDIRLVDERIPVIVVSIRRSSALPEETMTKLKISRYVTKPITGAALAEEIRLALVQSKLGG